MIQRINNQNYTNKYSQNVSKVKNTGDDTPAFLLGNEEEGVIWERQEERKDKKNQKSTGRTDAEDKHRNIDGYSSAKPKAAISGLTNQDKKIDSAKKTEDSFDFHQLKDKLVGVARKLLKRITNFFWYGDDANTKQVTEKDPIDMLRTNPQTSSAGEFEKSESEDENSKLFVSSNNQIQKDSQNTILSPQEKDERIRELLAKKDTEAVMDILTEHHTRQLAKKTGLLTQYDRHGSIKIPGGSEQSRILADDKGMKM